LTQITTHFGIAKHFDEALKQQKKMQSCKCQCRKGLSFDSKFTSLFENIVKIAILFSLSFLKQDDAHEDQNVRGKHVQPALKMKKITLFSSAFKNKFENIITNLSSPKIQITPEKRMNITNLSPKILITPEKRMKTNENSHLH
jgi:hypothetical protein